VAMPGARVERDANSGELAATVAPADLPALASFLRDDPELQFVRLTDICGVDNLNRKAESRFAAVYHFHSLHLSRWLRVVVPLDEAEPTAPSLTGEFPSADWPERETYDLYGFNFTGHPGLERLLLPDDWEGHPLRKDYPFEPEEIEFSFSVERVNAGKVQRRSDYRPWQTTPASGRAG
jgi:NADH-quinone oxidoreductase subunit C